MEFFGYGRRICPGRHFAMDMLWLAAAHILSVFAVEGAEPRAINGEKLEEQFTPRFIRCVIAAGVCTVGVWCGC